MEPQIQYVRTSNGVNIAYYEMGKGEPVVVVMDLPYSHLQAEWHTMDTWRAAAAAARVIRYDHRGFGLSQRGISDFPFAAMMEDLITIVDRLGLDRFVLFANRSPVALRYAARFRARVTLGVVQYGPTRA